jgi:hypothetical protein
MIASTPPSQIRFLCHACGKRLKTREAAAGRSGACPRCYSPVHVPRRDGLLPSPTIMIWTGQQPPRRDEPEEEPMELPTSVGIRRRPQSPVTNGLIVLGQMACSLGFLIAGVALWKSIPAAAMICVSGCLCCAGLAALSIWAMMRR